MNDLTTRCMKCGSDINEKSRFCSSCGSSIYFQLKLKKSRYHISWKWIFVSMLFIFFSELFFASVAGQIFIFFNSGGITDFETSIMVSSAGSLAGIFAGSFYLAYISPCITIKEPFTGISLEILISQMLLVYMAGTFTYMFFTRTGFTLLIAFAGVKTGDMIQRKIKLPKQILL